MLLFNPYAAYFNHPYEGEDDRMAQAPHRAHQQSAHGKERTPRPSETADARAWEAIKCCNIYLLP